MSVRPKTPEAVLDGIIEIAENEMVRFGVYVSRGVVSRALADSGAVCGGRVACLVGAAYLAGGGRPDQAVDDDGAVRSATWTFSNERRGPDLELYGGAHVAAALRALDRVAIGRVGWLKDYEEDCGLAAENYFEEGVVFAGTWWGGDMSAADAEGDAYDFVRERVIEFCREARELLKEDGYAR